MTGRALAGLIVVALLVACGGGSADPAPEPTRALRAEKDRLRQDLGRLRQRLERPTPALDGFPVVLANTEVHDLVSTHGGHRYRLDVKLPRGYRDNDRRYPVLYVLDAETNFGGVTYIVQRLIKDRLIPEILVVGVAYGTDYDTFYEERFRDLTPTPAAIGPYGADQSGGADDFSVFLADEVFPFVETTYRAEPGDRALYGHSLGGLFGFYVLLDKPWMFDRYLLLSPSLWWDCKAIFGHLEGEASPRRPKVLFVATGEHEDSKGHCDDQSMVDHQIEMVAALRERGAAGLSIDSRILDGETHRSIFGRGFTDGLRAIYEAPGSR